MADQIVVTASEDAWNGNAQFTIDVDGLPLGGTTTVTASHVSGQTQQFLFSGDFGPGRHAVSVHFINDAYGGSANTDRNLYIENISFNGLGGAGETLSNTAMNGSPDIDPNAAEMYVNGTVTFQYEGAQTLNGTANQDIFTQNNGDANFTQINNFTPGPGGDIVDLRGYGIDYDYITHHMTDISRNSGGELFLPFNGESILFFGAFGADSADKFTPDNFRFDGSGGPPMGPDTLVLHVSEDAWNGDARLALLVDGQQIENSVTVTQARFGVENLTFHGDFGASPHTVEIRFLNDAYGGSASTDRNLYVDGITFNGTDYAGETAQNTAMNGQPDADPHAAEMYVNGSVTFTNVGGSGPPPPPSGTTSTLVLHVSEDAFQGNAQFNVRVDGAAQIATFTATASHGAGQTQDITITGDFGVQGPDTIDIQFLNDTWGGTPDADRNLYIQSLDINGVHFAGNTATNDAANGHEADDPTAAVMDINGIAEFHIAHTAPPEIIG